MGSLRPSGGFLHACVASSVTGGGHANKMVALVWPERLDKPRHSEQVPWARCYYSVKKSAKTTGSGTKTTE
jgi:hypothetical protein